MRFATSQQLLSRPFDCQSWENIKETANPEKILGCQFDRYAVSLGSEKRLWDIAVERLFYYKIYPSQRMLAHICSVNHRVAKGCLIIQRIFLSFIGFEAAVKVIDVFNNHDEIKRKTGYSYVTLEGHPESGVITFSIEQLNQSDEIQLVIESWSKPGNLVATLFKPLARFIQKQTSRQALLDFKNGVSWRN